VNVGIGPGSTRVAYGVVASVLYRAGFTMNPLCPCIPPPVVVVSVAVLTYNIYINALIFSYVGSPSSLGRVLIRNFNTISLTNCNLNTMMMECVEND